MQKNQKIMNILSEPSLFLPLALHWVTCCLVIVFTFVTKHDKCHATNNKLHLHIMEIYQGHRIPRMPTSLTFQPA